jgi:tRNA(fMet)-specific endonuclease VapC
MYFLDTDTLTRVHGGNPKVARRIEQIGVENVATTVVTAIEILRGRHEFLLKASDGAQLLQAQKLLLFSENMLRDNVIFPVDAAAAAEFDRLRQLKKLKVIGRRDLLISCIAISHGATLVTRNLEHFRKVPGLKIENWVD